MHSPRHEPPSRTIGGKNKPDTPLPETTAETIADETDTKGAEQPLRIVVTSAAVEELSLRILAREAIPMLRRPHDYSEAARQQTARSLNCLLDGGADTEEEDETEEEGDGQADTDFRWSEEGGY